MQAIIIRHQQPEDWYLVDELLFAHSANTEGSTAPIKYLVPSHGHQDFDEAAKICDIKKINKK